MTASDTLFLTGSTSPFFLVVIKTKYSVCTVLIGLIVEPCSCGAVTSQHMSVLSAEERAPDRQQLGGKALMLLVRSAEVLLLIIG